MNQIGLFWRGVIFVAYLLGAQMAICEESPPSQAEVSAANAQQAFRDVLWTDGVSDALRKIVKETGTRVYVVPVQSSWLTSLEALTSGSAGLSFLMQRSKEITQADVDGFKDDQSFYAWVKPSLCGQGSETGQPTADIRAARDYYGRPRITCWEFDEADLSKIGGVGKAKIFNFAIVSEPTMIGDFPFTLSVVFASHPTLMVKKENLGKEFTHQMVQILLDSPLRTEQLYAQRKFMIERLVKKFGNPISDSRNIVFKNESGTYAYLTQIQGDVMKKSEPDPYRRVFDVHLVKKELVESWFEESKKREGEQELKAKSNPYQFKGKVVDF